MVYLKINDEGATSQVNIEERAVIGRLPECSVQLKEPHASRKHAVIYRHGEEWYIRDLDTRNGTFVNGHRIHDREIKPGDVITIGRAVLTFVDESAADTDKPAEAGAPPGREEKVGDYRITEEIAHSSYARVCRVHKEGVTREMVMKIIDPGAFASGVDDLFATARALAGVDHPAIASIYEVNPHGEHPYIVSEYVHGQSLAELIATRGKLPHERARKIVIRVAEGLQAAHAKGIVHGNLKPRNILVGEGDEVKLVDFGCICPTEPAGDQYRASFAGIPYYIAPEQIRKNPADERTDIYSLGAIFFSMVCGVPPFTGGSDEQIVQKHLWEQPGDLKRLVPDLPEHLSRTIRRALAKDAGARFQNMPELLAALAAGASRPEPPPEEVAVEPAAPASDTPEMGAAARRAAMQKEGNPVFAFFAGVLLILMLVAMFLGASNIGREARELIEKVFHTTHGHP